MNNSRIFTESKADVKFIKDYCKAIFNVALAEQDFDTLGGWTGYKTKEGELKPSIKENAIDNSKLTIIILDADQAFQARLDEVQNDFKRFLVVPEIFLFPNHKSAGTLETLLSEIVVHKKIIDCFSKYENCIDSFEKPVEKSKIFAYLDALLPEANKKGNKNDLIKEENRDYTNTNHWNLNHEFLMPLKEFLRKLVIE